MLPQNRKDGR
jgi:membrane-bound ClpP family serine protease